MAAKKVEDKKQGNGAGEDISYIRHKINSLSLRGRYSECVKMIEDNLEVLYHGERWPEQFLNILQTHRRCYPSLHRDEPYEEYARQLLRGRNIPAILASMTRGKSGGLEWKLDTLRGHVKTAREEGDWETALDYLDLLLKVEPHNAKFHSQRGKVLEELGRGDDAVESFQSALELNPGDVQACQGVARQYGKTDVERALHYLDQAIARFPDEAGFLAEKARLLQSTGADGPAMELWDAAMRVDPYNADYPYEKAELLMRTGKEVSAVMMYNRAVSLDDKHIPSRRRLASILQYRDPKGALGHIAAVLAAEPANLPARLLRAKLYYRQGDLQRAVREYKSVLKAEENNLDALEGVAHCYKKSNPHRALEYFDRVLSQDANRASGHLGRAAMLEALGEEALAIASYKRALALDRENPEPLGALGRLHTAEDPAAAVDYFTEALKLDAENAEYLSGKAEALAALGRDSEAVESLNLACRLDQGNALMRQELAVLLERTGNRASSLAHYRAAVRLLPDLDRCHCGIARQLYQTEPHLAIAHINAALQLNGLQPRYYYWKAKILIRLEKDEHAKEQLRLILDSSDPQSRSDDDIMAEIADLLKGDSLRIALLNINRAIEMDPQSNTYLCLRGNLLYDLDQQDKAFRQFETLLEQDPGNHEALYGLGRIYEKRGEFDEAIRYLDRAIALQPESYTYYHKKAVCLSHNDERYGEALACFDTAISLDRLAWDPLLRKAQLMDRHGDTAGAVDAYRRTLLLHPGCLSAMVRTGELLSTSHPAPALTYLDHAAEIEPGNWYYHGWLGRIRCQLGQSDQGRKELDTALELGGNGPEVWHGVASILKGVDDAEALRLCEKALDAEPDNAAHHILAGDIYLNLQDLDSATECYKQAVQREPGNATATLLAARVLLQRHDRGALHMVDLTLKADKNNLEAMQLKAEILDRLFDGHIEEAVALLDRAVRLSPNSIVLREQLVTLLRKKKSLIRLAVERTRLERLRQSSARALEEATDASFWAEEKQAQELPEPPPDLPNDVDGAVPSAK